MSRFRKLAAGAYFFLLFALTLYLTRYPILTGVGAFLMKEDRIDHADAILTLNGMFPRDVLEAADLYREGVSKRIIFVRERKHEGHEELVKRGGKAPDVTTLRSEALRALGVPASAVEILGPATERTVEEARRFRGYLYAHPEIRTLLLISLRPQARRAKKIFETIVGDRVQVYVRASRYDRTEARSYWKDPWHLHAVVYHGLAYVFGGVSGASSGSSP